MSSIIENPPRTMIEVYEMLPEGTLAELIDNQLYMSPAPQSKHQITLNEINFQLLLHFKKAKTGMVYIASFDVYLDDNKNVVHPDLIVLLNENMEILKETRIHGVPDMILEILSKHNKSHDLVTKKNLYEKFGVKEYWVIDPDTRLATGYQLNNARYQPITEDIGLIKSNLLNNSFPF